MFGTTVACSLAELSSAAPTAGGLYFWTFKYAPPRWRYVLSWVVGCKPSYLSETSSILTSCKLDANTMGLIAGMASVEWACAVQIMAAVSIGSNLMFTPTTGQI